MELSKPQAIHIDLQCEKCSSITELEFRTEQSIRGVSCPGCNHEPLTITNFQSDDLKALRDLFSDLEMRMATIEQWIKDLYAGDAGDEEDPGFNNNN